MDGSVEIRLGVKHIIVREEQKKRSRVVLVREVLGRRILTEYEEIFAADHSALIIVDMQNDFLHDEGFYCS